MLCLFETPAGFALFKVLDQNRIKDHETLWEEFETLESAEKLLKLKAFSKFDSTTDAVAAAANLVRPNLSISKQGPLSTLATTCAAVPAITCARAPWSRSVPPECQAHRCIVALVQKLAGQRIATPWIPSNDHVETVPLPYAGG